MPHALGNHEALLRAQLHAPILEIDDETPLNHVEKLVQVVVLVPVVFPFDHTKPYHRFIHAAEGLVVPRVSARCHQIGQDDHFERPKPDIEVRVVGEGLTGHGVVLSSPGPQYLGGKVRYRSSNSVCRVWVEISFPRM